MSFISMNTRAPLTPDLAKARARAKEAKSNVTDTVGRFQQLDKKGVDDPSPDKADMPGVVVVTPDNPGILPKTQIEQQIGKVKDKFKKEGEGEAEAPKMATGNTSADAQGVKEGSVVVTQGDKTQDFNYKRMDDGTEVYHGPTSDGYAVVRENAAAGTLFVELSEQPNVGSYRAAISPNFSGPDAVNDPEATKPKTLGESLKAVAESTKTSGEGTYMEGVHQRTQVLMNVGESVGKAVSGLFGGLFGSGKGDEAAKEQAPKS